MYSSVIISGNEDSRCSSEGFEIAGLPGFKLNLLLARYSHLGISTIKCFVIIVSDLNLFPKAELKLTSEYYHESSLGT
jgi:hypothetical protein